MDDELLSAEYIDNLFRSADFSSDNAGHKSKLRCRLVGALIKDKELDPGELSSLAAARGDLFPNDFPKFLRKKEF